MPTTFEDVDHLLRRAGFGGTTAETTALMPLDWPNVVNSVLDTSAAPSPDIGLPGYSSGSSWQRYIEIVQIWMDRCRVSPTPIQEKMVLFWHGHLCSSIDKVSDARLMFDQNQLFRRDGLGGFENLLQQAAVQPAMLLYLDNASNESGDPNENFARELMELFTLGVGHYSEDDVRESARAWTGHGVDDEESRYEFHSDEHDFGLKTFMGDERDWDGPQIIDRLLNGSTKMQVARFMSTKVWEFFAYSNPDPSLIEQLATGFAGSDLNMTALLRSVFLHPEFRSQRCRQGLVRSPIDFIVALMRRTGVDAAIAHPEWNTEPMGQAPFQPPNVAGWKQNEAWISPSNVWGKRSAASTVRWHLLENTDLLDNDEATAAVAVEAAFQLFGIYNPSGASRSNLEHFYNTEPHSWARRAGLLLLTPLTPDFQMA